MSRLELAEVTKSFAAVDVIRGVDLDVADREFVVFVGPSGCGKSTLLRIIAGLETATSGTILLDGRDVTHVPAADRGLAMVFQSYALYPHMNVRQNLAFGLENARTPRTEVDARIAEIARMLRIEPLLARKPRQLSGGQRQRVAIGRAMVRRPGIFLLDEPLSNLDAELRVVMRTELAALHDRLAATMIYVTHDQVEAMTLADRIVVLRDGRIEQVGSPLDLYNSPRTQFVAGFIGSPKMNFLPVRVERVENGHVAVALPGGGAIRLTLEGAAPAPGETLTLGVRPHHLAPGAQGLTAEVRMVEQLGAETLLHSATPSGEPLLVALPGQVGARVGETLRFDLDRARLYAFDGAGARVAVREAPGA